MKKVEHVRFYMGSKINGHSVEVPKGILHKNKTTGSMTRRCRRVPKEFISIRNDKKKKKKKRQFFYIWSENGDTKGGSSLIV